MSFASQVSESRKLDALLLVARKTGKVADQRKYETARRTYCVRHGLPYVAPIWEQRERRTG